MKGKEFFFLIEGIEAGTVVIFGGGNAAENAADMAVALGCKVIIIELGDARIAQLKERYAGKQLKSLNQQQKHWKKILNLQMSLSQQS